MPENEQRGTHLITLMVNVHGTSKDAADIASNLEEMVGLMDGPFPNIDVELNSCEVEAMDEVDDDSHLPSRDERPWCDA